MPRGAAGIVADSVAGGTVTSLVVVLDLPVSGRGAAMRAGALGCSVRVGGVADGRVDGVVVAVAGGADAAAAGHREPW
jgi:hypothetical protein